MPEDALPVPTYDLDTEDVDAITRRVVRPVLGALLRPGEVDEVDVSIGPDRSGAPEHLWGTHLGPEPGRFVWLRVLCSGEAYDRRVCEVTDQPEDAFALSCDLYSDLQEFVAESRFGWGQLRDGDWTVPPP